MASDTRRRIVDEARRLFARQGYAGTSVAEIERAAGLKPGGGGLYAHFESKEELLAAAIEQSVALADAAYAMHAALPLDDLRSELTVIARGSFALFDATQDWIRIRLKDGDQFPQLFAGDRDLGARAYRYLADWLRSRIEAGVLVDHDADATADVLFGAISSHWQRETLMRGRKRTVERDRFVAAWVDLASRLAAPSAAA